MKSSRIKMHDGTYVSVESTVDYLELRAAEWWLFEETRSRYSGGDSSSSHFG